MGAVKQQAENLTYELVELAYAFDHYEAMNNGSYEENWDEAFHDLCTGAHGAKKFLDEIIYACENGNEGYMDEFKEEYEKALYLKGVL